MDFKENLIKGKSELRRASHKFSLIKLSEILKNELKNYGISTDIFEINVPNTKISDQDPEQIHINYQSVFEEDLYLPNRVLIELGARSLNEPTTIEDINSIIDDNFPGLPFSEKAFRIKAILPEKTFLEKMILLHEEFTKPVKKIRYHRMSRHLYDIYKIIESGVGKIALKNDDFFRNICQHRSIYTPIKSVDYNTLSLRKLIIIPPDDILIHYRNDYAEMQENMMYGDSPGFDEIIEKLKITQKPHNQ